MELAPLLLALYQTSWHQAQLVKDRERKLPYYRHFCSYQTGQEKPEHSHQIVLKKGEKTQYYDYEFTFTEFEISGMTDGERRMSVRANLQASYKYEAAVPLKPVLIIGEKGQESEPVKLPGPADAQQAAETAKILGQAADLVDEGQAAMKRAADELELTDDRSPDKVDFASVASEQQAALTKLAAALALLDQPQQNASQNQSGQDPQQQNQEQTGEEDSKQQQARQQKRSAAQLLQLIRDREAQRRKDKQQAGQTP